MHAHGQAVTPVRLRIHTIEAKAEEIKLILLTLTSFFKFYIIIYVL